MKNLIKKLYMHPDRKNVSVRGKKDTRTNQRNSNYTQLYLTSIRGRSSLKTGFYNWTEISYRAKGRKPYLHDLTARNF